MVSGGVSRIVAVLSIETGTFQLQGPVLSHYATQIQKKDN